MKKFSLFAATAFGLLFTACSSDDVIVGSNDISTDSERTFYVNLNIRGDVDGLGSRATAEDNGEPVLSDFAAGESDVADVYFVFYDKDGTPVGSGPVKADINTTTVWETGEDGTVDKYYQSTVGVTIGNGQDNPAQVVCYVNPLDESNLSANLSGDEGIQEKTRTELYKEGTGNKKYFSMSNSVFYNTTAAEAPQIAVQIAPNQLFNTRDQAENALKTGARTVNIYVERYAAKMTFKTTQPNVYETVSRPIAGTTETKVELTFVPKTWMLNASCNETYIVKSFREESQTGDILADNYAYQELDAVINKNLTGENVWKWNSATYNRSYWGMSPAYFTSVYPEVSSDVAGLTLNQKYYSYNELLDATGGKTPQGFALPTTEKPEAIEFVHETTVGSKALASKNIVAALPSVILVGDYTVKIGAQTLTNTDFYTYGIVSAESEKPLVYFSPNPESLTGESSVPEGESILRGLLSAATNLYKKVDDNYVNFDLTNPDDLGKLVSVFEVEAPSATVKGNLKVPERYRTLQLLTDDNGDVETSTTQLAGIYIATTEGYMQIAGKGVGTPPAGYITALAANQELMKVVGFCAKYNAGAAYFNIPVKHYGWYRPGNPNNKANATMDWTKVNVGDFGVVRNHSYTVNVTAITGIGTGIGGKDNPIVPPAEENRYYIAYSVNILKWAVVPEQSVAL